MNVDECPTCRKFYLEHAVPGWGRVARFMLAWLPIHHGRLYGDAFKHLRECHPTELALALLANDYNTVHSWYPIDPAYPPPNHGVPEDDSPSTV